MKPATLLRLAAIVAIPVLTLTFGLGAKKQAAVRVTMDDGQVLYGDARTARVSLHSTLGELKIPLGDIGEILPVEGDQMEDSEDHVRIWLRDGSELVGQWSEPELAMTIDVGKESVRIDVPTDDLGRLQTQGGEVWPRGAVYRVRTVHGDDFLVDAKDSRFTMVNQLGTFSPSLADCVTIRPVDDPEGDWRIELATGTVLIGELDGSQFTLAMPMGPESVTLPLASFVSMEQQSWGTATVQRSDSGRTRRGVGARKASSASYEAWDSTEAVAAPQAAITYDDEGIIEAVEDDSPNGWFRRHGLEQAKQSAN